jgi:hypothetical protein
VTLGRASLAFALGRDLLFAVVACATAVLISLSVQLDMTKQELREHSLAAAARDIAERLAVEPGGTVDASAAANLAKSAVYPTMAFDAGGRVLLQHPGGLEPELVTALSNQRHVAGQPERPGTVRFFQVAVQGRLIDGAVLQTGTGGDATTVEVYKDESSPDVLVDGIVREFPYRSARVLLPLFALLLFGSGCIVWSRMRPIAEVAAIAETIGPHTLNLRLPERNLPAEVLPIVRGVKCHLREAGRGVRGAARISAPGRAPAAYPDDGAQRPSRVARRHRGRRRSARRREGTRPHRLAAAAAE